MKRKDWKIKKLKKNIYGNFVKNRKFYFLRKLYLNKYLNFFKLKKIYNFLYLNNLNFNFYKNLKYFNNLNLNIELNLNNFYIFILPNNYFNKLVFKNNNLIDFIKKNDLQLKFLGNKYNKGNNYILKNKYNYTFNYENYYKDLFFLKYIYNKFVSKNIFNYNINFILFFNIILEIYKITIYINFFNILKK